jgi:penicillin-binding protein 1C
LWLSPKLAQKDVCIEDPQDASRCYTRSEYFIPGTEPGVAMAEEKLRLEIIKPTDGLQMAVDPRIPLDRQKLPFTLHGLQPQQTVEWILNGQDIATSGEKYLWPLSRGHFTLSAHVMEAGKLVYATPEIGYVVK